MLKISLKVKHIISAISVVIITLAPVANFASIPNPFAGSISFEDEEGQSLNLNFIARIHKSLQNSTPIDFNKYIPANMRASNSQTEVASKIVTHGITRWLSSEEIKKTTAGKAAHTFNKALNPEMAIGKHEVKLRIDAGTSTAALKYKGLVNATVKVQTATSEMDLSVSQDLLAGKKLVLNHNESSLGSTDTVSLRWSW